MKTADRFNEGIRFFIFLQKIAPLLPNGDRMLIAMAFWDHVGISRNQL
jgi:hypothetical protein